MKKTILALFCVPTIAFAAAPGNTYDNSNLILIPSVATDGVRTERVNRTSSGDLVVCPTYKDSTLDYSDLNNTCVDKNQTPAWIYPAQTPPKGKTYVGFKIVSGNYGRVFYEFYWK